MPPRGDAGTWQAPLRELSLIIVSRGKGLTRYRVVEKRAEKGDRKATEAILAEGDWPKDPETREDLVRALVTVCIALDRMFVTKKT